MKEVNRQKYINTVSKKKCGFKISKGKNMSIMIQAESLIAFHVHFLTNHLKVFISEMSTDKNEC